MVLKIDELCPVLQQEATCSQKKRLSVRKLLVMLSAPAEVGKNIRTVVLMDLPPSFSEFLITSPAGNRDVPS